MGRYDIKCLEFKDNLVIVAERELTRSFFFLKEKAKEKKWKWPKITLKASLFLSGRMTGRQVVSGTDRPRTGGDLCATEIERKRNLFDFFRKKRTSKSDGSGGSCERNLVEILLNCNFGKLTATNLSLVNCHHLNADEAALV